MFTLWVDMTKDYWFLNGYDKINNSSADEEQANKQDDEGLKVKRIERGDTNICSLFISSNCYSITIGSF